MRNLSVPALLLAFLYFSTGAEAQVPDPFPLEVRLSDHTKNLGKEKIDSAQYGKGEKEKFENTFSVELGNPTVAPIEGLKLKLIPFYISYDWQARDSGHEPGKIQIRENVTVAVGETKKIDFEPEAFYNAQSRTASVRWRDGQEYTGVVIEVYQNGILVTKRIVGDVIMRKAYASWAEKNDEKGSKPGLGADLMK